MDIEPPKTINITGTNNRYQMKKLINKDIIKQPKKSVISEKWTFSEEYFEYSYQMKLVKNILYKYTNAKDTSGNVIDTNTNNDVVKIVEQQINKKISSYKNQDKIKNRFNNDKFITFDYVIKKIVDCELKCRYCKEIMNVLYDISREMKQWSVDRIDNNFGHNIDNFHLACLDCNLKRRCKTDDKFLFTKQLNIVKQN